MASNSALLDDLARVFAVAAVESVVQELEEKRAAGAGKTPTAELSLRFGRQDKNANHTTPAPSAPR